MADISKVTVNNTQYNMPQASALKQRKLMTLIGSKIAYASKISKSHADLKLIKGLLLSSDESVIDEVATITLDRCVKNGNDSVISIDDFQGEMNAYFDLLAEGIKVNLDDFFTWLDSESQNDETK